MPRITKIFSHSLEREAAIERIKKAIATEKINKANVISNATEQWVSENQLDYSLRVFGYRIDGSLLVEESNVTVDLELPVVAMMVKGMVEDQLAQEIAQLLS